MRNILKPLPSLKQQPKISLTPTKQTSPPPSSVHPTADVKPLQSIFNEPLQVDYQSHNGLESLISNPQPPQPDLAVEKKKKSKAPSSKVIINEEYEHFEPQYVEELPVQIMVQSPNEPNNYQVISAAEDDSRFKMEYPHKQILTETTSIPQMFIGNAPDNDYDHDLTVDDDAVADDQLPEKRSAVVEETITTQQPPPPPPPETVTITQPKRRTTTSTSTTPRTRSQVTSPKPKPLSPPTKKARAQEMVTKKTKPMKSEKRKNAPSLDKIAEKVFQKYKNHEEISSYEEDIWYDDDGDMLWSQEDTVGRNVKRQAPTPKIVQPVPRDGEEKVPEPKTELEKLKEITETIERFRSMLDIAQQVEYYLTKRLQAGVNALAAIYGDAPFERR